MYPTRQGPKELRGAARRLVARQLSQFAPAPVLLGLSRVAILLTLEPKSEPVHCALLRRKSFQRLDQSVRPAGR